MRDPPGPEDQRDLERQAREGDRAGPRRPGVEGHVHVAREHEHEERGARPAHRADGSRGSATSAAQASSATPEPEGPRALGAREPVRQRRVEGRAGRTRCIVPVNASSPARARARRLVLGWGSPRHPARWHTARVAGWLFVDAPLEPGEELLFRRVCTLRRGRRSIGGEVSVTDRRLLFVPNRLEQLVGVTTVRLRAGRRRPRDRRPGATGVRAVRRPARGRPGRGPRSRSTTSCWCSGSRTRPPSRPSWSSVADPLGPRSPTSAVRTHADGLLR